MLVFGAGVGFGVEESRRLPVVVEKGVFVFFGEQGRKSGREEGEVSCEGEEGQGVGEGLREEEDLGGRLVLVK